jgi:hypothetical protein
MTNSGFWSRVPRRRRAPCALPALEQPLPPYRRPQYASLGSQAAVEASVEWATDNHLALVRLWAVETVF